MELLLAASPTGPRLVVAVGIIGIMAFVAVRSIRRVEKANASGVGELKQMSISQRWRAFKLAKSGERIDDPIDRRLARRWLDYVFNVPTPGWKLIAGLLALGVVADILLDGSVVDAFASRIPLLVLIALGAIWVMRLKKKYRATAQANEWDFSAGSQT